jgi:hypothetical protein
MISLENIPTEDVVFFSVIVFGGLYTIFFYIMVGFFIKKKKDNFAEKLFGDKTHHPTFLYVIESTGKITYEEKKFGLALFSMHKNSVFRMSMYPTVFQTVEDGILLMSEMNNNEGKRYKFGKINFIHIF